MGQRLPCVPPAHQERRPFIGVLTHTEEPPGAIWDSGSSLRTLRHGVNMSAPCVMCTQGADSLYMSQLSYREEGMVVA